MKPQELINFLGVIEKLKCNTRHSWTSSDRHESVAEHSWRLACMAYLVKDEFPTVDIDKVIVMCLIHDFGEAITGDIPAFNKTKLHEQIEKDAVDDMISHLPPKTYNELKALFKEMDQMQTPEAKLTKALDKLETLIQHNEGDISRWLPLEYEKNLTYGQDESNFSEYTKILKDYIKEMSIEKAIRENPFSFTNTKA